MNQYTLAYHLLEQRQVSEALDRAREAVRLDPTWKEAWHLLALCVSAQKDMKGALAVLETAIELEESGLNDDESARRWEHPTDATERLAVEMQLRLTRNAVIEYLEGPAAALVDQQEILAYFSAEFAQIAAANKALASTQPASASAPSSEQRNRGGLAPPGSGGGASVSRAASILSRRRSSKKRKSQGLSSAAVSSSGSAMGPIPPLHAATAVDAEQPSSVLSTPARSVLGESTAASVTTAVSATVPSRSRSRQAESPTSTGTGTVAGAAPTTAAAAIRPSPDTDRLATKLLADTWLASAASFRRAGKLDEARGAVSEAEALDVDDADVWTQLALVLLAAGTTTNGERDQGHDKVKDVLTRAMAIDPNHVPVSILMARRFLTRPVDDAAATAEQARTVGTPDGEAAAPTWKRPLPTDWLVVQVPLAEAMLETIVFRDMSGREGGGGPLPRSGVSTVEVLLKFARKDSQELFEAVSKRIQEERPDLWDAIGTETKQPRRLGRAERSGDAADAQSSSEGFFSSTPTTAAAAAAAATHLES